jgi:uncharacterized protein (DUF1330 family)
MPKYLVAVTLWVRAGEELEFRRFEETSLAIAARHGGRLLHAARLSSAASGVESPYEFHLLAFQGSQEFAAFRADPESLALDSFRQRVIAKIGILNGYECDPTEG